MWKITKNVKNLSSGLVEEEEPRNQISEAVITQLANIDV